ncbi:hypothetical protein NSK_003047 [Nannochloropsis salina CCMP1776]|uniref:Mitochondrial proton/calcium exchanger protein n=1 Tax=Nannochloropsis salina CCMP1776 TaxID=1027361 RepID=A0A4D9DAA1_9STRA|nr:hypothetical protein NSK_003047 [Nannochloropsis salina CCMP1776]|eukprot:TFJ85538.1 hypothetical protein NSK_003047 [Nannochloropsis salina CCMP1776]
MLRRNPAKRTLARDILRMASRRLVVRAMPAPVFSKVARGSQRGSVPPFSIFSMFPPIGPQACPYHVSALWISGSQSATSTFGGIRALSIDRRRPSRVQDERFPASRFFLPQECPHVFLHPRHLPPATSSLSFSGAGAWIRPFSSQPAPKRDPKREEASKAAPVSGSHVAPASPSSSSTSAATNAQTPPRYVEEGIKPEDLKPAQGVEDPRKEENSPATVAGILKRYTMKALHGLQILPAAIFSFTVTAGRWMITFVVETVKNPSSLRDRWLHLKKVVVEEFHHYKLGSKVLWSDIKTSSSIVSRVLHGNTLSRRERRQLTRTTADLFRLVPFAFFVIVPFMELLLPFALKIFPNMLPSTFQDNLKKEENLKRELKVRLALAGFLKDTLGEIASKKKGQGEGEGKESPNAALLTEFVEKARAGTHISTNDINRFARLFKDELTLDNMSRPQLAGMCVYMGLRPYGSDNFLRFQLRAKLRNLKEDDQRIVWEGVDNMNKAELREACRERGMRAYGLTQLGYRRQLQQWLDLSINKEVPISLLILSRAFTLDSKFTDPAAAVADSISSLDEDVVNEVLLDVATRSELQNPDLRARKLESIERQNELIEEERKREEGRKKKAEEEKKKAEEEKKKAEKAEEEKKKAEQEAAADTTAASAPGKEVEDVKLADPATEQIKEAVAHASAMTGSSPAEGVNPPPPPPAELFPLEKVLTENEVVSTAKPSLDEDAARHASGTSSAAPAPASSILSTDSSALEGVGEKEASEAERKEGEKRELTAAEIAALRTLLKESSVEQEKTVLAQLKAELQASPSAKVEAVLAAVKGELQDTGKEATGAGGVDAGKATLGAGAGAGPEKTQPAFSSEKTSDLDLTLPPPSSSAENVPDAAQALAASTAPGAQEAPSITSGSPTSSASPEGRPPASPAPEPPSSAMDKALERMRMKVASMLDKLEVDMEKVESTIGDKLHMLDKDKDGVLTTAELSEVISHVLKRHTSEEEAQKIASTVDKDADGILTVQELMEWIEHREELLQELGEEENNASSASATVPKKTPTPLGMGERSPGTAGGGGGEST